MMRRLLTHTASLCKRLNACQSGSFALELGIVLPVLSLMIVGTFSTGWLLYATNVMYYAVQQAARCVAINAAACQAVQGGATQVEKTQAYAASMAMGLNVTPANFSVTQPACGWQVTYNYTLTFVAPFYNNFNVTIPASACYPAQP